MKKYMEILKSCPLFANVDEADIEKMLICMQAKTMSIEKKYTIFAEGKPAKYIGIVLSGAVQTIRIDYYGNRSVIGRIEAGGIFGEAFACAELDSIPITVEAENECEVMLIDASHILHTCSNNCNFHRQLIFNLMKSIALQSVMLHERIEITSKRTTREKLMAYLAFQAKGNGSNVFNVPFDRQTLADYLEVDRSGLSSEISKLRAEGVIKCVKNRFELLE